MRRITIHLLVALLTFAVGTASFALLNSFRALFSNEAERPNLSLSVEPPTATPVAFPAETLARRCGCNQDYSLPEQIKLRAPVSGGVLNARAISLPQPPYPPVAKAARASGTVVVQIVFDESGCVISARAVSGHPLLQAAAVAAARQACFSPTRVGGEPVKVSGVITYNFMLS